MNRDYFQSRKVTLPCVVNHNNSSAKPIIRELKQLVKSHDTILQSRWKGCVLMLYLRGSLSVKEHSVTYHLQNVNISGKTIIRALQRLIKST
jgi:hypothetical protein